jgi:phage-related protein
MADRFTWCATKQSQGDVIGSVRRAKFGDGYAQSSANGINPVFRNWNVEFVGKKSRIQEIVNFLDSHVGKSFVWEAPFFGDGYFYCDNYKPAPNGMRLWMLTGTFEQTYQPTESEQPVPLYLDGSVYLDGDQFLDGFKR